MTPDEFKAAQRTLGHANREMAEQLGVSRSTLDKYRSGSVRVPLPVAKLVALMIEARKPAAGDGE